MKNKILRLLFNLYRKNETHLHELKYLFWECTRRCNLNCIHCGSDCSSDAAPDSNFDDFLKAILPLKEVYAPNTITVAITGGEPLLRKDLGQCGKILRQHGFLWGIVTNGCDYTPAVHKQLLSAGMGSVTLSIDGLEESHNWLRNNSQSFERAVKALDTIVLSNRQAGKFNYDVVTCVNCRNFNELEKIYEFLKERGTKAWRLFTISPIGRAAGNSELQLRASQLKTLMEFIAQKRRLFITEKKMQVTFSCEAYTGSYEGQIRDGYFFCRAGVQIASVLIDGSISACPNIDRSFIQGNIYKDNFLDVWNKRFKIMRDRRWTKTGICKTCKDYKNCLGGAMHLWNENKDGIMICINNQISANS